jgi:hypothetical protein
MVFQSYTAHCQDPWPFGMFAPRRLTTRVHRMRPRDCSFRRFDRRARRPVESGKGHVSGVRPFDAPSGAADRVRSLRSRPSCSIALRGRGSARLLGGPTTNGRIDEPHATHSTNGTGSTVSWLPRALISARFDSRNSCNIVRQALRDRRAMLASTSITARTRKTCIQEPIAIPPTIPSSQRKIKIATIVHNMAFTPFV